MTERVDTQNLSSLHRMYVWLVFWLAIPVVLTSLRVFSLPDPYDRNLTIIVFNFAMVCASWVVLHLSTLLVAHFTKRLVSGSEEQNDSGPGFLTLALGALIGSIALFPTRGLRADLYCLATGQMQSTCDIIPVTGDVFDTAAVLFRLCLLTEIYWLVGNYIVATLFDVPRYGFRISHTRKPSLSPNPSIHDEFSPLLSRLPLELGEDILSISANQHYLEVRTRKGSTMVLYRLSDAAKELGDRGARIHRSHWVAYEAIRTIEKDGTRLQVVLDNGDAFPVSRGNQRIFKQGKFGRMQLN